MAAITEAQANEQLTAWLAASLAVASGQSYSISGRSLTRADAAEIRQMVKFWNDMVKSIDGTGGMKVTGVTPCV